MPEQIPESSDSLPCILPYHKAVTYRTFQNKLRYCTNKIGLNPWNFSFKSLRRGCAALFFRVKVPAVKIQQTGIGRSDAYKNI